MKATRNIVKTCGRKCAFNRTNAVFLINSKKLKNPENVAVAVNNFFLTVAEILNLHQVGKEDVILFFTEPFPGNFPGLKKIVTTETQIKV